MITETVVLKNELGLHLRPASRFVKIASRYKDTTVEIARGADIVNGKSVLGVMMLAAGHGSEIELRVHGPEEEKCMKELVDLVNKKFFED